MLRLRQSQSLTGEEKNPWKQFSGILLLYRNVINKMKSDYFFALYFNPERWGVKNLRFIFYLLRSIFALKSTL